MSTQDELHPFWKSEAFRQVLLRARQRAIDKDKPATPKTTDEVLQMATALLNRISKNKKP